MRGEGEGGGGGGGGGGAVNADAYTGTALGWSFYDERGKVLLGGRVYEPTSRGVSQLV